MHLATGDILFIIECKLKSPVFNNLFNPMPLDFFIDSFNELAEMN